MPSVAVGISKSAFQSPSGMVTPMKEPRPDSLNML